MVDSSTVGIALGGLAAAEFIGVTNVTPLGPSGGEGSDGPSIPGIGGSDGQQLIPIPTGGSDGVTRIIESTQDAAGTASQIQALLDRVRGQQQTVRSLRERYQNLEENVQDYYPSPGGSNGPNNGGPSPGGNGGPSGSETFNTGNRNTTATDGARPQPGNPLRPIYQAGRTTGAGVNYMLDAYDGAKKRLRSVGSVPTPGSGGPREDTAAGSVYEAGQDSGERLRNVANSIPGSSEAQNLIFGSPLRGNDAARNLPINPFSGNGSEQETEVDDRGRNETEGTSQTVTRGPAETRKRQKQIQDFAEQSYKVL